MRWRGALSLRAIFTADSGIAGIPAGGVSFAPFNRRENHSLLAIFYRKKIAHLGAYKIQKSPRRLLVSVKFVSAILGPDMAAPILWAPGKNAFFLQENVCP